MAMDRRYGAMMTARESNEVLVGLFRRAESGTEPGDRAIFEVMDASHGAVLARRG